MSKLFSGVRISLKAGVAACLAIILSQAVMAQAAISQQEGLDVSIKPVENGVEFVLTNTSDSTISLLRWETPFEQELTQDVFVIAKSDASNLSVHASPASFSGRLFKRPSPSPADFIDIAAGQSLSTVVNLADYYQLAGEGSYQVSFQGEFYFQEQEQSLAKSLALVRSKDRSALSHRHHHDGLDSIFINTGQVSVDLTPVPEVLYARVAGYTSCTAAQQAELPLDFDASETIIREAREALEALPENERAGSPRYQHWFGTYSSDRYASLLDTYTKAEALMSSSEVEFACDCDEPFFAFVRRTEPFKVNLCTFYWAANRLGTDSRAGTILHEVSHFNEIGATSGFAYGALDVSRLADTSPASAVVNADSIEYFAENTPFREISSGAVQSVEITPLAYGVEVNGSVERLQSVFYEVTGADRVTLTTLSGDADLLVYSDREFTNTLCESRSPAGSLDVCEINTADTVYVDVRGYMTSTYRIVADIDIASLQVGQTQTSEISAGEWSLYTVTGAGFVQLESRSGDADLYVYTSASFDADSLICDSRNTSNFSAIDSCNISGTVYIGVLGTQAGQYSITALVSEPVVVAPESIDTTDTTDTTDADGTVVTPESVGSNDSSGGGPVGPGILVMLFVASGFRTRSHPGLRRLAK